ncbi:hypothetical protein KDH_50130 [Dictyobacter sp. S3.2.2.5]|uniref:Uncharacterized protein n=1 Tax=Dictyobacter halimunensis TaxID=3026934 RepID=A0ABQ6FV84_9CHLR|nr:hypothetical protein KDH_50130 [Dictyobacter sp. S3.2.2.5]
MSTKNSIRFNRRLTTGAQHDTFPLTRHYSTTTRPTYVTVFYAQNPHLLQLLTLYINQYNVVIQ